MEDMAVQMVVAMVAMVGLEEEVVVNGVIGGLLVQEVGILEEVQQTEVMQAAAVLFFPKRLHFFLLNLA